MAAEAALAAPPAKLVVTGIGLLLSGDLARPVMAADAIVVERGVITAVGPAETLDLDGAEVTIDARGGAVCPGLIDGHVHPVFGDWTPRQNQLGWIEACVHGGVTTMVSAGEVHLPGRPKDPLGIKSLAYVAQRCFHAFRPLGAKVLAGSPVPESSLTAEDYAEMAANGICRIGEIGLGTVAAGLEARRHADWCRKAGLETVMHTGGPSIAGSHLVGRDAVLEVQPDVVSHVNGGPTALSRECIRALCREARGSIEVVHNGNGRAALAALETMREAGRLDALLIGTDAPAGSGVQPLGMLRMVALLASLGGLPAAEAFCLATGNVARRRGLEGGLIEPGRAADLVFLDRPEGSSGADVLEAVEAGDLPGIGAVMIDGVPRTGRSRNTPPAARVPVVQGP